MKFKDSCHANDLMPFCSADLSAFNSEKADFGFNWTSLNSSLVPPIETQDSLNAFQYTSSLSISSFPFAGISNYLGGGYVFKMNGNSNDSVTNFTFLEQNNWIDRQTRALFVEFSLFNPNVNMFVHCSLLFEFLPTGSIVKSYRFSPMTLFDGSNSLYSFGTISALVYLVLIFALTMRQVFVIKVQRTKYFKSMWTYFNMALIAFSFTSFAIWLYRIWEAQKLMDYLSRPQDADIKYLNLQMLAYWDDLLGCMLAMCACLGSLKFMKILQFNRTIRTLSNTIKVGYKALLSFGRIFMICMFAWIQAGFVLFNAQIAGLSTFVKAIETCFLILMGKFELSALLTASLVFTVVFFTSFNIFVVMILLNMFISVITNAFAEAKKEEESLADPLDLDTYLYKKVNGFFRLFESKQGKEKRMERREAELLRKSIKQNDKYMNELDSLNYKTSALVDIISLV
jgi:polycystin 1L2